MIISELVTSLKTRLRGCAAGVTPLKIFAMCSQLFVTGWQKLNDNSESLFGHNRLKSSGNKQCR